MPRPRLDGGTQTGARHEPNRRCPPSVRLEGCVVDDFLQPRANTPVRALAADGRLLASALSDADGKFRLQVPSGQRISLAVDKTDGDVTKVATGPTRRVLTTCLFDPSA